MASRVDGRLDGAVHRDARRTECARGRRVPVHRVHHERLAGRVRRRRELTCDRDLAVAQLVRERAVAAEVRREEHRVDVVALEQRARRTREAERVLLARARKVDGVRDRRGRRQRAPQGLLRAGREDGSSSPWEPSKSLATAP